MLGTKTKLAALLILVTCINFFFFHLIGNLGYVLLSSALFAFVLYLFRKNNKINFLEIGLFSGLSLILLLRSSFLIILFSVACEALIISTHVYESIFKEDLYASYDLLFLHPIFLAFQYMKSSIDLFILRKAGFSKLTPKKELVISVIRGILITAPILLILIALLTSADPIYSKFLRDLFYLKIDFANRLFQRAILSLAIFLVLLPLVFLEKVKSTKTSALNLKMLTLSQEMVIVSSLIALTLGSFLFIQFKYIFASVPSETELIKFGINTYSEYVRRGFIELALASFLVYSVTKIGLQTVLGSQGKVKDLLTKIQLFGLFELVVFIFSIGRRVWLYQSYHGLSVVRIYGLIFLIWVLTMTAALIFQHFNQKNLIKKELAISLVFVFILGLTNVENIVAVSNRTPTVNGNIDYVYLSRLSDEGATGWLKSYNYAKSILIDKRLINKTLINREERREVAYVGIIVNSLLKNYYRLNISYGSGKETVDRLFMWNYSSNKAWQVIKDEIGFENLLTLQKNYDALSNKIADQPENERDFDFDISLSSPLVD